jgi:hypothetical protein
VRVDVAGVLTAVLLSRDDATAVMRQTTHAMLQAALAGTTP